MNILKRNLKSLMIVPIMALGFSAALLALQPVEVSAQGGAAPAPLSTNDRSIGGGAGAANTGGQVDAEADSLIQSVVNTLLFIIGAVAVIMLIFGGFRYVTSGGDSNAVTSAKNTILYAVIGIVVAVLAYAIVNFVLGELGVE